MTASPTWWSAPPDERAGRPVVVALHGRGADASSLAALAPDLPDDVVLVCPRGRWPEGAGYAWWQMHAVGYPVAASLAAARLRLFHWLDAEVGDAEVALLAFSDGAVTAFDLLLAEPGRFAASALFGGAIPWAVMNPPGAALAGSPVLFSYGADDEVIGREPLERTARWLQDESGADVEVVVEPGLGHVVSSAQVARARALLGRVLTR